MQREHAIEGFLQAQHIDRNGEPGVSAETIFLRGCHNEWWQLADFGRWLAQQEASLQPVASESVGSRGEPSSSRLQLAYWRQLFQRIVH